MEADGTQLCYLLVLIVAIGFIVWGFMDILKSKQHHEKTQTEVISRQIRGFAFIMMAQVILLVGSVICFGLNGGLGQIGRSVSKIARK